MRTVSIDSDNGHDNDDTQSLCVAPSSDDENSLWYRALCGIGWTVGGLWEVVCGMAAQWSPRSVDVDQHRRQIQEALDRLRKTLHVLSGHAEGILAKVDVYATSAKVAYQKKHIASAVHNMRLKKMHEKELSKIESLRFSIESNILRVESLGVMYETIHTIRETNDHFQLIQRNIDVDRLEDTIEELYEQRECALDIETLLHDMSRQQDDVYDEEDMLKEIESMMSPDSPDPPDPHPDHNPLALPAAPTGSIDPPKRKADTPAARQTARTTEPQAL